MFRIFLATGLLSLLFACSSKYAAFEKQYQFADSLKVPDYNRLEYWAAHPWKRDPSDSIPRPLRKQPVDSIADVFFIHPTTYTGPRFDWNAPINDTKLNVKTDYTSILYQASVFNQHSRIFAPRYRQAHIGAFFADNDSTREAFNLAYSDLRKAFMFYMEYYNQGRPIIIAGHSQGAKLAEILLKEFFDGKPLSKQLVAAYILGWAIPQNFFDSIPVCKDALQTGCFCGWRTLRRDYIPEYMKEETVISYVTNPLNWTTNNDYAEYRQNKGSILRKFNQLIRETSDAQVNGGVLWVNRPRFPGSVFFRSKNYHIADINLFYMNLRENVEQRIMEFKKRNP